MYYLGVIRHPEGEWGRMERPTQSREDASLWLRYQNYLDPAGEIWLLYHPTPDFLETAYTKLRTGGIDQAREAVELQGEPGDHDTPYQFRLPPEWPVQRDWSVIAGAVKRGEIGGEHDGADTDRAGDIPQAA